MQNPLVKLVLGVGAGLLWLFVTVAMGQAETRNYTKPSTLAMNGNQLAAQLGVALGFTPDVTVGITPTLVIVSHPSLSAANDAAVNSAIAAYTFDPLFDQRVPARQAYQAASDPQSLALRASAAVLVDELNLVRQGFMCLKAAVAAATSLANLQTRVALCPDEPDRTLQQATTAIQQKITNRSAD